MKRFALLMFLLPALAWGQVGRLPVRYPFTGSNGDDVTTDTGAKWEAWTNQPSGGRLEIQSNRGAPYGGSTGDMVGVYWDSTASADSLVISFVLGQAEGTYDYSSATNTKIYFRCDSTNLATLDGYLFRVFNWNSGQWDGALIRVDNGAEYWDPLAADNTIPFSVGDTIALFNDHDTIKVLQNGTEILRAYTTTYGSGTSQVYAGITLRQYVANDYQWDDFRFGKLIGPDPPAVIDTVAPTITNFKWLPRTTSDTAAHNYLNVDLSDGPPQFASVDSFYAWKDGVLKFQRKFTYVLPDTTLDSLDFGGWYGWDTVVVRVVDDSGNVSTASTSRLSGITTVNDIFVYVPTWTWGYVQGVGETGGTGLYPRDAPWGVMTHIVLFGINALDTVGIAWDSVTYGANWKTYTNPHWPYNNFINPKRTIYNGQLVSDSTSAVAAGMNIYDARTYGYPHDSADVFWNINAGYYQFPRPTWNVRDSIWKYSRPPFTTDTVKIYLSIGGIYGYGSWTMNWVWDRWRNTALRDSVFPKAFCQSIVAFANRMQLDGIEIDWEPPNTEESQSAQIRWLSEEIVAQNGTVKKLAIAGAGATPERYNPNFMGYLEANNFMMYGGGYLGSGWGSGWNVKSDRMGFDSPVYSLPLYDTTKYGNAVYYMQSSYDNETHMWSERGTPFTNYGYGWHPNQGAYTDWDYAPQTTRRNRGIPFWLDSLNYIADKTGTLLTSIPTIQRDAGESDSSWMVIKYTPARSETVYTVRRSSPELYFNGFYYKYAMDTLGRRFWFDDSAAIAGKMAYNNGDDIAWPIPRADSSRTRFMTSTGAVGDRAESWPGGKPYKEQWPKYWQRDTTLWQIRDAGGAPTITVRDTIWSIVDGVPGYRWRDSVLTFGSGPDTAKSMVIWDTLATWDTVRVYSFWISDNVVRWIESHPERYTTQKFTDDTIHATWMVGRGRVRLGGGTFPMPGFGTTFYCSYEDTNTIRKKVQYAKAMGLGSVGIYELWGSWLAFDTNDRLPLIRVMMDEMGGTQGGGDPEEPPAGRNPRRKYFIFRPRR